MRCSSDEDISQVWFRLRDERLTGVQHTELLGSYDHVLCDAVWLGGLLQPVPMGAGAQGWS